MKSFSSRMLFMAGFCFLLASCSRGLLSVITSPQQGAPGDIVIVTATHAKINTNTQVQIGSQKAMILSSTDSTVAVMVPAMPAGATRLTVMADKQKAQTAFTVNSLPSLRFWFSLNNGKATFLKTQPTGEDFIQDKSYSANKLMYELVNKSGSQLAVGYINDPTEVEVLQADQKGLAKTNISGEVEFSITVPALQGISAMRLTLINKANNYKASVIGEVPIDLTKK